MHLDGLHRTLAEQRSELEQLRLDVARREDHIRTLKVQLKVRSRWDEDLRQTAENLDAKLLARDQQIAELHRREQSLRDEVGWRRAKEKSLQDAVDDLSRRLATVESTRLWRAGQAYWRLKDAVRRALRRR